MKITVSPAADGWRWHAKAEIVRESGEAYEDKSCAIRAAKDFGPRNAVIVSED